MANKESENAGLETLSKSIDDLSDLVSKAEKKQSEKYAELHQRFDGADTKNAETAELVRKTVADYAEISGGLQQLRDDLTHVKAQVQAPIFRSESELADHDRKTALQIQREMYLAKGGDPLLFKEDHDDLVNIADYRSAVRKMMRVGIESKAKVLSSLTDLERKAFEASTLGPAFFTPQVLALEIDCNIECASLLDLYGSHTVSRSNFNYMQIKDYGDLGQYTCDARCDAEFGQPGNIQHLSDKTYDYRGVFCFQRKVLDEANYDFLSFMIGAASRSHRIKRNEALMIGDGINQPKGWMTADCFKRYNTPAVPDGEATRGSFTHQDWRRFIGAFPAEYGRAVAVMHQNVFGYLAAYVDNNGRFIFGDGDLTFSPESVRDRIRISNCLDDPTAGNTLGGVGQAAFVPGSFIAANAAWATAYYAVSKRPIFFEQYEGGSSAWCVQYQFGAEDGGFVGCCEHGQTLYVG